MSIMSDISIGIYCQVQTKLSIVSLKGIKMIGTQKYKYYKDTSFRMLLISTMPWYQQNNGLRNTLKMLKLFP